jgi:hypothetical protein
MKSNIISLKKLILVSFIILVSLHSITAQKDQKLPAIDFVYDYAILDPSIDAESEIVIKERIKTMVQQYAYSSSFGEYTGEFSSEKYGMFSKLFTNNARLTNYILKKPVQEETFKYIGFVWDNIQPKSIEQKFRNGELLSIEKDASGNYRCMVVISIEVNSVFDDKTKKLSSSPKSRRVDLKGLAILEPGHIDRGSFIELTGDIDDDRNSKIALNIGALYSLGSISGGSGRGFDDVKPSSNALGLYADISKSVGASGKWHVWAGVGYQSMNISTDITGKYIVKAGDVSNFSDLIENNTFNGSGFPEGTKLHPMFLFQE